MSLLKFISRNQYKLIPFSFRATISLKQDVRVAIKPQPCVSPALCQGHADLPECAEFDDELDCPGEPADDFVEYSGMLPVLVCIALASHHMFDEQMRKKMTTILHHPPLRHPHPHFAPFLTPNHLVHLEPSVLVVPRTDILQWRSRHLLHGKGNRLPNGFPSDRTTRNPSPRSVGRQSAWHVSSAENARSRAGSLPKVARIGRASQFLPLHSFLVLEI